MTPGNWSGYAQLVSPRAEVIYGTLPRTWATHRAQWSDHATTLEPNACTVSRP